MEEKISEFLNNFKTSTAKLTKNKEKLEKLKEVHLAKMTIKSTHSLVVEENQKLKQKVSDLKTNCESWTKSAKLAGKYVSEQIPHQTRAILGGDFRMVAEIRTLVSTKPQTNSLTAESLIEVYGVKIKTFVKSSTPFATEMSECSIPIASMLVSDGRVSLRTSDS